MLRGLKKKPKAEQETAVRFNKEAQFEADNLFNLFTTRPVTYRLIKAYLLWILALEASYFLYHYKCPDFLLWKIWSQFLSKYTFRDGWLTFEWGTGRM